MYSDIFCKVYNEFGWNYYPEIFGEELLNWLQEQNLRPSTALDLACGTGVLSHILKENGMKAAGVDLSEGMIAIARQTDPDIPFEVGNMITYRPKQAFDLVTCTGDAINHIASLSDIEKIFRNVFEYLQPGGVFLFDLLNKNEISDSEPFEIDYDEHTHIWFQMLCPQPGSVNLKIRVSEDGKHAFEENIFEYVYDPDDILFLLRKCGFSDVSITDTLRNDPESHGTTYFIISRK